MQSERNQFRASGRTKDSPDLPASFFLEGQMLPSGANTFPGLSFMWNLQPYIHNPMSIIIEACDKAEFAHVGIKQESSEQRRMRGNPGQKDCD